MFAQNLLVIFLILLVMLTAIDPALAGGKKKKSKADIEVEKALDPVVQELTPLTQKSTAHALFSPEEDSQAQDVKMKLLDLIKDYPTSELLVRPVFEAGRLFRAREMYDDAFDFYNYIQTNFPTSPYALQSKVEIQRMKQQLGDQYFIEPPAQPAASGSK
jgi:hypothetical protein